MSCIYATKPTAYPLVVPTIQTLVFQTIDFAERFNADLYILGTNFRPYSVITFGSYVCNSFYNSAGSLGFRIPPQINARGTYSVQVLNTNYVANAGFPDNTPLASNQVPFTIV